MNQDAFPSALVHTPAYQRDDGASTPQGDGMSDVTLKLDNMLLEEFSYASSTAYQAMDDLGRMFDRYLLLVAGFLGAGIGAVYQLSQVSKTTRLYVQPVSLAVLFAVGLLGLIFFISIVRLRRAYRESLIAMNVVKEFYISQCRARMTEVEKAFRWRLSTIPAGERFGSVTFVRAYTIALLGSFCFGLGASVVADLVMHGNTGVMLPSDTLAYEVGGAILIVLLIGQLTYFHFTLSKRREQARVEEQEKKLGLTSSVA